MLKLRRNPLLALAWIFCLLLPQARAEQATAPAKHLTWNWSRVRFYPAPGHEQAMVGGTFEGSNVSPLGGFETLARIKETPPAGEWSELTFPNEKIYRWLRYVGPPGSHGAIGEIEFYSGDRKLNGNPFGSIGVLGNRSYHNAFDGKPNTWFESDSPDGQFVAIDLWDYVTAKMPALIPAAGEQKGPLEVTLKTPTRDAIIRYTLDGTTPAADHGEIYTSPIKIDRTTTIVASAFLKDRAPSPISFGTYLLPDSKPGLHTFHLGNSLTGTTHWFGAYCRSAGYNHDSLIFARPGALTEQLWDAEVLKLNNPWPQLKNPDKWEDKHAAMPHIDMLTFQPRDFNIAREIEYEIKFLDLLRKGSPDLQPWLYIEWTEYGRHRPSDEGSVPSSEMKTLWPAVTWQESMAGMLLYGEELQRQLLMACKTGKRPHILPSGIAFGWLRNMIDRGQFPGLSPGDFYPVFFKDQVHPNDAGGFLVDCTWYAGFYRESPEGKVLPIGTGLTAEQARVLARLAWDVVRNYPDCGLYEEGSTPVNAPAIDPAPAPISDITPVHLTSSTPGAWFRYTLDGATPTRTSGYLYCGVISVRPGMTIKAIAFKSGMADSLVSEFTFPAGKRDKLLVSEPLLHGKGLPLDLSVPGPLAQYVRVNSDAPPTPGLTSHALSLGSPNQTLWFSAKIRCEKPSDLAQLLLESDVFPDPKNPNAVAIGAIAPENSQGAQAFGKWGLRIDGHAALSDVSVQPGQPATLVLRADFGEDFTKPVRLSLYVNPPTGAEPPAQPQATAQAPKNMEWRSIGLFTNSPAKDTFTDLRIGESFGAVAEK